jgi:glycosyltransferase involved in cell wall biosynthesis
MIKEISIFVLAYNEEHNIKSSVESAIKTLQGIAEKYEVIVVLYEGSTDSTEKIVKELMKKHPFLRLVIQKKEIKGYGAALKNGIKSSRYEHISYTDADNQFDINEMRKLLPYLKDYDVVSGYRKKRKDPLPRLVYAKAYNILIGLLFGEWFRDIDSAFKIYKKKIFKEMKLNITGGVADAEILIKARKSGFKIKEVPVTHFNRPRGKSKFESKLGLIRFSVIGKSVKDVFDLWKEVHFK